MSEIATLIKLLITCTVSGLVHGIEFIINIIPMLIILFGMYGMFKIFKLPVINLYNKIRNTFNN